jgi:peptidyl-tRNA hydrolase, PTH1 family
MKLIVGLGNPGKEYDGTRHNFGFAVLDKLAAKYEATFSLNKKFHAETCELFIEGEKIILVKPQTFMNKSGESVREIVGFYNISNDRVWVIYDDIDLDIGSVRIRKSGSSGGHKGVQSIIDNIGTEEFVRFRLGIKSDKCDCLSTEEVVLQRFGKEEESLMNEAIDKAVTEIEKALKEEVIHVSV